MLASALPVLSVCPPTSTLVPAGAAFSAVAALPRISRLSALITAEPVLKWMIIRFSALIRSSAENLPGASADSAPAASSGARPLKLKPPNPLRNAFDSDCLSASDKVPLRFAALPSKSRCAPGSLNAGSNPASPASQGAALVFASTLTSPLAASPNTDLMALTIWSCSAAEPTTPEYASLPASLASDRCALAVGAGGGVGAGLVSAAGVGGAAVCGAAGLRLSMQYPSASTIAASTSHFSQPRLPAASSAAAAAWFAAPAARPAAAETDPVTALAA